MVGLANRNRKYVDAPGLPCTGALRTRRVGGPALSEQSSRREASGTRAGTSHSRDVN